MNTTETPGLWINNPSIIAELNKVYKAIENEMNGQEWDADLDDWECRVATYMHRQAVILSKESKLKQSENSH